MSKNGGAIHWDGIEVNILVIGPKEATGLLEIARADPTFRNRKISQVRVSRYARDLREGRWSRQFDPIRIGTDGVLLDGQHRLHAIVQSKVAIPMLVIWKLDRSVFSTLDAGRPRSVVDALCSKGTPDANRAAAIISKVITYRDSVGKSYLSQYQLSIVSPAERIEVAQGIEEEHPGRLHALTQFCHRLNTAGISGSPSIAAVILLRMDAHPELAARFGTEMEKGEGLMLGSASLALRNRLLKMRGEVAKNDPSIPLLVAKAWNAFVEDRPTFRLQVNTGETYPELR